MNAARPASTPTSRRSARVAAEPRLQLGVRRDARAADAPLRERQARPVERRPTRLDWSIDVDPEKGLVPDMGIGIYGTPIWDQLTAKENAKLRHEAITWQLSQFLHGEQGALLATAQIVDAVPWFDAKHYAATQVMDEARHVEVYRRYLQEKLSTSTRSTRS